MTQSHAPAPQGSLRETEAGRHHTGGALRPSSPKNPCMRPALLSAEGAGALGCSLLCTGSALGTRHLPQITSEEFVPFTFTTSPFSSQLQGKTRPCNHSSNRAQGIVGAGQAPQLLQNTSCSEPAKLQLGEKGDHHQHRVSGTAATQQGTNPGAWPGVAETAEDGNKFSDKAQEGADLPGQGSPRGLSTVAMTEKLR